MPSVGSSRRRLGEQGARDGELLLLSAGEDAALAREELLENRKERVDLFESIFGGGAFDFVDDEADAEVLLDGEVGKNIAALRDIADAGASAGVGGEAGEAFAIERDGAGAERAEAHHGAKRGRLAHAVAAHEGDELAFAHLERDAAKNARAVDVDFGGGDGKERIGHRRIGRREHKERRDRDRWRGLFFVIVAFFCG
jgi:hypothetical protein